MKQNKEKFYRSFLGEADAVYVGVVRDCSDNEHGANVHYNVTLRGGHGCDEAIFGGMGDTKASAYKGLEVLIDLRDRVDEFIINATEAIAASSLPEDGDTGQQQLELES